MEPLEMFWVFWFYDAKEMVYLGLSAEEEPELCVIDRNGCGMKAEFRQRLSHMRK